jgi:hypothetical protein
LDRTPGIVSVPSWGRSVGNDARRVNIRPIGTRCGSARWTEEYRVDATVLRRAEVAQYRDRAAGGGGLRRSALHLRMLSASIKASLARSATAPTARDSTELQSALGSKLNCALAPVAARRRRDRRPQCANSSRSPRARLTGQIDPFADFPISPVRAENTRSQA